MAQTKWNAIIIVTNKRGKKAPTAYELITEEKRNLEAEEYI